MKITTAPASRKLNAIHPSALQRTSPFSTAHQRLKTPNHRREKEKKKESFFHRRTSQQNDLIK